MLFLTKPRQVVSLYRICHFIVATVSWSSNLFPLSDHSVIRNIKSSSRHPILLPALSPLLILLILFEILEAGEAEVVGLSSKDLLESLSSFSHSTLRTLSWAGTHTPITRPPRMFIAVVGGIARQRRQQSSCSRVLKTGQILPGCIRSCQ